MKKFLILVCAVVVFSFVFCSCQSKEQKVIDQLKSLTEKIEKNSSDWDSDQWTDALADLEKIHEEMKDCEFNNEQLQTLGEVEGRLTTVVMTEGAKAFGKNVGSFLQGAGSYIKGFKEGAAEGTEETIEEIGNYVNSALDKLLDNDMDN